MNILLTCAGRRNYLVEFFQNELAGRGRVFACDTSAAAPALAAADEGLIGPSRTIPATTMRSWQSAWSIGFAC
jgi:carbamoyl-phosphate synthase large subunit